MRVPDQMVRIPFFLCVDVDGQKRMIGTAFTVAYSARNGHLIPRELAACSAIKWPPIPGFWPHVPRELAACSTANSHPESEDIAGLRAIGSRRSAARVGRH
jgi:hypothetical protein